MVPSRVTLARGNEDCFLLRVPRALGTVQYLHVWHDNSGERPSWFLDHIYLRDIQTGESWTFLCNKWFALEEGDGKVDRRLFPISPSEAKSFRNSLKSRNSKNFAEGHLWLSVVTKPPQSTFTRVQRATCCLCILLSVMVVNAMFYRTDKVADATIQVGPLRFSWRQVVVGIQSSLIVTPVNIVIAAIFKNVVTRESRLTGHHHVNKTRLSCLCCGRSNTIRDQAFEPEQPATHGTEETSQPDGAYYKRLGNSSGNYSSFHLPHCWVYVAWILSVVTIAVSAAFTFFYSLVWGKDIANQWLSSMMVSFTEDLFVLQPIKVCLVAIVLALLFQKRVDSKKPRVDESLIEDVTQGFEEKGREIEVILHTDEDLEQAREYREKEKEMFAFCKSLLGYLVFLALLTILCHGGRSQHGFLMTSNVRNTFKFHLVSVSCDTLKTICTTTITTIPNHFTNTNTVSASPLPSSLS